MIQLTWDLGKNFNFFSFNSHGDNYKLFRFRFSVLIYNLQLENLSARNWSYSYSCMPLKPSDLGTPKFKFAGTLWKFSCWDDLPSLPSLFCTVGIHWFDKLDRYLHILYSRTLETTFQISLTYSILINFTARQEPSLKNMGRSPFNKKIILNVCNISCCSSGTEKKTTSEKNESC